MRPSLGYAWASNMELHGTNIAHGPRPRKSPLGHGLAATKSELSCAGSDFELLSLQETFGQWFGYLYFDLSNYFV